MTSDPRYDFPAISDSQVGMEPDLEVLFEDHPDWKNGKRGQEIGKVKLTYLNGNPPNGMEAEFTFNDGDSVTYEGKVPGAGSGKGKGRVKFKRTSGKGKFKDRNDDIGVEFHNPKRWG